MNDHWQTLYKAGKPLCPEFYGVPEDSIALWRKFLKQRLLETRGPRCEACGKWASGLHLHEGLVKRNEISRSVQFWWRLYAEMNCFLVCYECHLLKEGLARAWGYQKGIERYGKEAIDQWLDSLPFREMRINF